MNRKPRRNSRSASTNTINTSIYVDKDILEIFDMIAEEEGISRSALLRDVIENFVNEYTS